MRAHENKTELVPKVLPYTKWQKKAARNVLNLLNSEHSCSTEEIPGWHRAPSTAGTCGSLGGTWSAVSAAAKSISARAESVQKNGLLNWSQGVEPAWSSVLPHRCNREFR